MIRTSSEEARALRRDDGMNAVKIPVSENSIVNRWARLVVRVIDAEKDPTTIAAWARHVYLGTSTLRGVCTAVGVGAKQSLDLARLLRAAVRLENHPWVPAAILGSRDPRTVSALLARTGCDGLEHGVSPERLLDRQTVVRQGEPALVALRQIVSDYCRENSSRYSGR